MATSDNAQANDSDAENVMPSIDYFRRHVIGLRCVDAKSRLGILEMEAEKLLHNYRPGCPEQHADLYWLISEAPMTSYVAREMRKKQLEHGKGVWFWLDPRILAEFGNESEVREAVQRLIKLGKAEEQRSPHPGYTLEHRWIELID